MIWADRFCLSWRRTSDVRAPKVLWRRIHFQEFEVGGAKLVIGIAPEIPQNHSKHFSILFGQFYFELKVVSYSTVQLIYFLIRSITKKHQQNQWQLNTNKYSKESSRLSQRLLKLMLHEVILFILRQSVTLILWKTADEKNIICVLWKQSKSFVLFSFCDINFVCTFCLWCFHRKQT